MHVFPLYKKWTVTVNDPAKFELYLKDKIEFGYTNRRSSLQGKRNTKGFLAQIKARGNNNMPPVIKGVLGDVVDGKQTLTLTIQSSVILKRMCIGIAIVCSIIALVSLNFSFLISIPIYLLMLSFIAILWHITWMDKTKVELNDLISNARGKN
jgi:hypothetical protein